ncbi:MAG: radical SAM protein [Oscillospiraceae bacterium]|nr:radical SAM protein [Oscillospiraceae bacterium]
MIRVLFISFGSEWHDDVWNVLAIESLVGDLKGAFPNDVYIETVRLYKHMEIDTFIDSNNSITDYDLIGCSIEIGSHNLLDHFLIRLSENHYSNVLVLGGILATYAYDYLITLDSVQELKPVFIISEGEIALRHLVQCLLENNFDPFSYEPNTYQYDTAKGYYIMNSSESIDLESLVYSPLPIVYAEREYKIRIIQTSRNCIFGCTYCSQGPKKKWRSFSFERIKNNIEIFIKNGCNEFEFVDDEFFGGNLAYNINRAWTICDIIESLAKKHDCDLKFRIFTNPHIITSKNTGDNGISFVDILNRLKKLGLCRVYLGVESGAANQRKRYNRRDTLEECSNSIYLLESLGIEIDVGFIMFDPEVTLNDISENIDFIQHNNILKYNTWPLRPMILTALTPMYQRCKSLGLITKRNEYNVASFEYVFLHSDVSMIFERISKVADSTAKVFYIIKYIYKNNFYEEHFQKEVRTISGFLEQNTTINFDCIKEMISLFREGNGTEVELNKTTLTAFIREYDLISSIEQKMRSYKLLSDKHGKLASAIMQAKEQIDIECRTLKEGVFI